MPPARSFGKVTDVAECTFSPKLNDGIDSKGPGDFMRRLERDLDSRKQGKQRRARLAHYQSPPAAAALRARGARLLRADGAVVPVGVTPGDQKLATERAAMLATIEGELRQEGLAELAAEAAHEQAAAVQVVLDSRAAAQATAAGRVGSGVGPEGGGGDSTDGDDDAKPTVKQLQARQGELFAVLDVQPDSEDALTELRDVVQLLAYAKAGC
jgi:hypothetical protein